jgi:RNA polymerase sigma factor (sigma-70 family)
MSETATSLDPHPAGQLDDLVAAARRGERQAWNALVARYSPLVRAVASGFRLTQRDVEDVDQTVWLRLVENLDRIREPRALPRWLMTTAGNEALRLTRAGQRTILVGAPDHPVHEHATEQDPAPDTDLLRRELAEMMQRGLSELSTAQQRLLTLLVSERSPSYREISRILAMPVGSVGPTRARCLARLRDTAAVREYIAC